MVSHPPLITPQTRSIHTGVSRIQTIPPTSASSRRRILYAQYPSIRISSSASSNSRRVFSTSNKPSSNVGSVANASSSSTTSSSSSSSSSSHQTTTPNKASSTTTPASTTSKSLAPKPQPTIGKIVVTKTAELSQAAIKAIGEFLMALPANVWYYITHPTEFVKKMNDIKEHAKTEAKHYWMGTKLLMAEIRTARKLMMRTLSGSALTRRERKQLLRTTTDLFRLVPMSMFVLIPFMELALPFALKIFPNMLPSTFQDSLKKEEDMKRELKSRIAMAGFFQETLQELAKEKKKLASSRFAKRKQIAQKQREEQGETELMPCEKMETEEDERSAKEFMEFLEAAKSGQNLPVESIIKFSKFFKDDLTLDHMGRMQLTGMCTYMSIAPYGSDNFLRFQLRFKIRALKEDDQRILWEGIDSLTKMELREACQERGMRSHGLSKAALQRSLQQWLDLSVVNHVPISLLIMSRTFFLAEEDVSSPSGEDASISKLADTISGMEEEVVNEVLLEVATPEESKSNTDVIKAKLDVLEAENERIEEEFEMRRKEEEKKEKKKKEEKEEKEDREAKEEVEEAEKKVEMEADKETKLVIDEKVEDEGEEARKGDEEYVRRLGAEDEVPGDDNKEKGAAGAVVEESVLAQEEKEEIVVKEEEKEKEKEKEEEEKEGEKDEDKELSAEELDAIAEMVSKDPVEKEKQEIERLKEELEAVVEEKDEEEEEEKEEEEREEDEEVGEEKKGEEKDESLELEIKDEEFEELKVEEEKEDMVLGDEVKDAEEKEEQQEKEKEEEEEKKKEEEEQIKKSTDEKKLDKSVHQLKDKISQMVEGLEEELKTVEEGVGDRLKMLDKDGDGILGREEMIEVLRTVLKRDLTEKECEEIVEDIDRDMDGNFTVEELREWVEVRKFVKEVEEDRYGDIPEGLEMSQVEDGEEDKGEEGGKGEQEKKV